MSADDARRAVAELAAAQHGVITRAQAASVGFGARRVATAVRQGWLTPALPGVLVLVGSRPTWAREVAVATLAAGGAVASHRTAARLHRLDGFRDAIVEVTVERGRSTRRGPAVTHRAARLERRDVVVVSGLRATSLVRTVVDLGAVVGDDAVERALDDALRRGASPAALRAALERLHRPGAAGTGRLQRVLDDPDRRGRVPDTWFERLVLRLCRVGGLPPPHPQHVVRDGDGRLVARLDLAWPEARLGLEAYSDRWHFGPRRGRRDRTRDNALAALGWELLYAGWADVHAPATLERQVIATYRRRVAELAAGSA